MYLHGNGAGDEDSNNLIVTNQTFKTQSVEAACSTVGRQTRV